MVIDSEGLRRLCRARSLLRNASEPAPSIRDVARSVRISPFHFIRQFEAAFGITPHQFRIRSRLDRAKLLLAQGRHSVTEVCLEVGFSSLGSFSALFARRVGEPPSAYARRLRTNALSTGGADDLAPGCLNLMSRLPAGAFSTPDRNTREAPAAEIGHTRNTALGRNDANQAHERDGRRPGEGAAVLHDGARVQEEAGLSGR